MTDRLCPHCAVCKKVFEPGSKELLAHILYECHEHPAFQARWCVDVLDNAIRAGALQDTWPQAMWVEQLRERVVKALAKQPPRPSAIGICD